jgi:hypothetical protein
MSNSTPDKVNRLTYAFLRLRFPPRVNIATAIVLTVSTFFLSTCTEELPAYLKPGTLFSARIRPIYSLTAAENKLHLSLVARNIFDETLDGPPSITGQVQLISIADPSVIKTFKVTSANVTVAQWHFPAPGRIAVDAGDTVSFDIAWDLSQRPLLDDSGKDLTEGLLFLKPDPTCPSRKKSDPQDFLIQGSVELFQHTGPAVANRVAYRFCLFSTWVNPKDCPNVTSPCSVILSGGN